MVSDYLQLVFFSNGTWFTLKGNVTEIKQYLRYKNPHTNPKILFHDHKVIVRMLFNASLKFMQNHADACFFKVKLYTAIPYRPGEASRAPGG